MKGEQEEDPPQDGEEIDDGDSGGVGQKENKGEEEKESRNRSSSERSGEGQEQAKEVGTATIEKENERSETIEATGPKPQTQKAGKSEGRKQDATAQSKVVGTKVPCCINPIKRASEGALAETEGESVPHKCPLCRKRRDLDTVVAESLRKKYLTTRESYNAKVINDIIYNENTHIVSVFKDYLIYDDVNEFLKRYYTRPESAVRLPKIYDFFEKYSKVFPNYVALSENKFMFKNIERKQRYIDEQQRATEGQQKPGALTNANASNKVLTTQFLEDLNRLEPSLSRHEPAQSRSPKDHSTLMQSYLKSQSKLAERPEATRLEDLGLPDLVEKFILKDSRSLIDITGALKTLGATADITGAREGPNDEPKSAANEEVKDEKDAATAEDKHGARNIHKRAKSEATPIVASTSKKQSKDEGKGSSRAPNLSPRTSQRGSLEVQLDIAPMPPEQVPETKGASRPTVALPYRPGEGNLNPSNVPSRNVAQSGSLNVRHKAKTQLVASDSRPTQRMPPDLQVRRLAGSQTRSRYSMPGHSQVEVRPAQQRSQSLGKPVGARRTVGNSANRAPSSDKVLPPLDNSPISHQKKLPHSTNSLGNKRKSSVPGRGYGVDLKDSSGGDFCCYVNALNAKPRGMETGLRGQKLNSHAVLAQAMAGRGLDSKFEAQSSTSQRRTERPKFTPAEWGQSDTTRPSNASGNRPSHPRIANLQSKAEIEEPQPTAPGPIKGVGSNQRALAIITENVRPGPQKRHAVPEPASVGRPAGPTSETTRTPQRTFKSDYLNNLKARQAPTPASGTGSGVGITMSRHALVQQPSSYQPLARAGTISKPAPRMVECGLSYSKSIATLERVKLTYGVSPAMVPRGKQYASGLAARIGTKKLPAQKHSRSPRKQYES